MANIHKIEAEMQRLLAMTITREMKDPSVKLVTITGVTVTGDLSYAHIYYTVMGQQPKRDAVRKALDKAKGFLKSTIAKKMKLRKVPELIFEYDESLDYGNHIQELLKKVNEEK